MTPFLTLYRKELKAARTLFLFLLVGTLVLNLYLLLAGNPGSPWGFLTFLPHAALILVTPFLLAHQYAVEWSSGTGQFLFVLPVPVWQTGVAKFLAVLTFAFLWFLVSTLGTHLVYLRFFAEDIRIRAVDFWIFFGAADLSLLLYLLGLAVPVTTIRRAVKRFRWGMATLALFLLVYITVKVSGWLFPLLSEWFPAYHITLDLPNGVQRVSGKVDVASSVGLALWGILWTAVGLWIMDRFTEF